MTTVKDRNSVVDSRKANDIHRISDFFGFGVTFIL